MSLEVSEVRNLAEQKIVFEPGFNLLSGGNGQGKSSVLEAIYLLGTTRSFRTSRLSEVVRIGSEAARVAGTGEAPGEHLALMVAGKTRSYLRHGKEVSAAGYIGAMDVVALSSDIVQRFRQAPSERRRFLDRMALATDARYIEDLRAFRRAAAQRALLVAEGRNGPDRDAWDERAAALAVAVARRRAEMALVLESHLRNAPERVFPEGRGALVRFISRPAIDRAAPEGLEAYRQRLQEMFSRQQRTGGGRPSPAGPAWDDLAIEIEGRNLLRLGSSGQMRSLLTAATLGEMKRLHERKGRYPVLVLDDVESDLDEDRYGALLAELGGGPQVFAATSKPRLTHPMLGQKGPGSGRYAVRAGVVAAA